MSVISYRLWRVGQCNEDERNNVTVLAWNLCYEVCYKRFVRRESNHHEL